MNWNDFRKANKSLGQSALKLAWEEHKREERLAVHAAEPVATPVVSNPFPRFDWSKGEGRDLILTVTTARGRSAKFTDTSVIALRQTAQAWLAEG